MGRIEKDGRPEAHKDHPAVTWQNGKGLQEVPLQDVEEQTFLELKDVICMPEPGNRVLNGISLQIEEGETVRITGRSGSGKTMLVRTLCGERIPEHGKVYYLGKDISLLSEMDRRKLRRDQFVTLGRNAGFLSDLTMQENVMLPLLWKRNEQNQTGACMKHREMKTAVLEAMEIFGVENAAIRKPGRLSGEELCRMQLTRAYLMQPKVIILADSFTAGLSQDKEAGVWQLLKVVQEEYHSTLVHLADSVGGCGTVDRALILSDGDLISPDADTGKQEEIG